MWEYNSDYGKWYLSTDSLLKSDYDWLKQELSSTRFYSKALSGSTYVAINDLDNLYDVVSEWQPRNWYISTLGSKYSLTSKPTSFATSIDSSSSYDFYTKSLKEYGLTLKNLFTPERLMKDILSNYIQVDVATTEEIDLTVISNNYLIDGVKLLDGHLILVKDQISYETLDASVNPDTYFKGPYVLLEDLGVSLNYKYYNSDNGLYQFKKNTLVKLTDLDDYDKCSRLSIYVKMGNINESKQFHLERLLNGFYPTSFLSDPMVFTEKHNWLLRNRVDYNNLFEINYSDILKHGTQSYFDGGVTYSIPERVISIGGFGIILNTQNGYSNIIPNKYKVDLYSIDETEKYYWICGDDGLLIKVTKHNFEIELISLGSNSSLNSISFYDNLRGVVVGEFNTIYLTVNGGLNWDKIEIDYFNSYVYNKVIFVKNTKFYLAGKGGVFIEFEQDINGWVAHKKRISKQIDDEDEYLLIDHINDMWRTSISDWGLSYSYYTQSIPLEKDIVLIGTDDGKLIAYNENNFVEDEFIYLDFNNNYGNIRNITQQKNTDNFYFSGDNGIYQFDIRDFQYLGIGNTYSNSTLSVNEPTLISDLYPNKLFDYNGLELLLCGNYSLLNSSTYSSEFNFQILDSEFVKKLRSKLLLLDYDMGSKLNFFDSSGEYILPNSTSFKKEFVDGDSEISFSNLIHGATAPNFMTQSETSWFDYWSDRQKTFEYYSANPLSETSKVLMSKTFSGTTNYSQISIPISNRSGNLNDILKLAPSFGITASSRYNMGSGPSPSPVTITDNTIFLKDYLLIIGVVDSFDVDLGDVIRLESNDVDGNFIVNKILDFGVNGKFIYMFTEFNENIITNLLVDNSDITITNLNKFDNSDNLINRFNNHPIGIGYKMSDLNGDSILIEPQFNSFTSYYNLSTEISVTSSNYLTFESLDMLNYGIPDGTSSVPQVLNCDSNINVDEIRVNFTIYHQNPTDIIVNLIGPTGQILNILNGPVDVITGTTFSNSTFSTNTTNPNVSSSTSPYSDVMSMDLSIGVGTYISTISSFSGLLFNGNAKGDWKLVVEDTVSGNIGYLKNWSISFSGKIVENLEYVDGFLKFGYTPQYNLLDYMTSINKTDSVNPTFYATKEYLAMPIYVGMPINELTPSTIFIDGGGLSAGSYSYNDSRIYFGTDLKLEWESLLLNTFVDITIYQPNSANGTYNSNRLLVLDKYYDSLKGGYVVKFHKGINFDSTQILNGSTIDIKSRRTLQQISDDLQELNNIQRRKSKTVEIYSGNTYDNYESDLNFKISTDSYAKVLLSDVNTVKNITGVIYTDFKNEISLNLTRMDKEYRIPILNTAKFDDGSPLGKLYIECSEEHDLNNGDGIVLEFNGGTYSSEYLNQGYFGYHTVTQVYGDQANKRTFLTDIDYGVDVFVGNDTGYVSYVKKDPFFNYEPVDLIDVSLNKRAKQSIQLSPDNLQLIGTTYSLTDVDFSKYRFRLVDGLTFDDLNLKYSWILEAEISDAIIGQDDNGLVWYSGIWEFGRWFGGTWYSGTWKYGDWYDGIWNSKNIKDKKLSIEVDMNTEDNTKSVWYTGRWFGGTWNDGTWLSGRYYGGIWNKGLWYNGIWNDGTWNDGQFNGGIWVTGTWNSGTFNTNSEPAYWIDGKWYGGDFENGMWYNGVFEQRYSLSRFGTNSFNSRTSTWHGGIFNGGSFYSKLDLTPDVSTTHKYSIWKTGNWVSGDFYGGIAYNISFKSGTWCGGILEDIEIIGINEVNNSFILNGVFRFNISDEIYVTNKFDNMGLSNFGSISNPVKYIILNCNVDDINKTTEIYIDYNISLSNYIGLFKSVVKTGTLLNSVYGDSNVSTGYSGSLIDYIYTEDISSNVNNVRIKINIETNPGLTQSLSNLLINLKAPNGNIINVKELGVGVDDIYLKDTTFTGISGDDFILGSPLYSGIYQFSGIVGTGSDIYYSNTNNVSDLFSTTTKGYWEIYIKSFNGLDVKINDLKLEFCYSDQIGAQLNSPITNGFDTGLRVVSDFTNANWKTGIWTNGIFESGLYETGIWYDGIFKGTWG